MPTNRTTPSWDFWSWLSKSGSFFPSPADRDTGPAMADEGEAAGAAAAAGGAACGGSSDGNSVRVSTLTLVDLAGSERISKTGAEGVRMKEGAAINKSLLTLGNVINKLTEAEPGHVPYRDSKLTRILQPSLGGNAKTAVICNVTPAGVHVEETHSTLRFACRAKRVQNHAVVNEVATGDALLKKQQREIEELRRRLAEQQTGTEGAEIAALRAQLQKASGTGPCRCAGRAASTDKGCPESAGDGGARPARPAGGVCGRQVGRLPGPRRRLWPPSHDLLPRQQQPGLWG